MLFFFVKTTQKHFFVVWNCAYYLFRHFCWKFSNIHFRSAVETFEWKISNESRRLMNFWIFPPILCQHWWWPTKFFWILPNAFAANWSCHNGHWEDDTYFKVCKIVTFFLNCRKKYLTEITFLTEMLICIFFQIQ